MRRYQDFKAWQLAHELNTKVFEMTSKAPACHDFKFRDNIRDAADSAQRNFPEGFGRFAPGDFAHFMDFSIASVMEIQDCLLDGVARKHFTPDRVRKAESLTVRSLQVSKGLKRYLLSARRHPRWKHRRTTNERNT